MGWLVEWWLKHMSPWQWNRQCAGKVLYFCYCILSIVVLYFSVCLYVLYHQVFYLVMEKKISWPGRLFEIHFYVNYWWGGGGFPPLEYWCIWEKWNSCRWKWLKNYHGWNLFVHVQVWSKGSYFWQTRWLERRSVLSRVREIFSRIEAAL